MAQHPIRRELGAAFVVAMCHVKRLTMCVATVALLLSMPSAPLDAQSASPQRAEPTLSSTYGRTPPTVRGIAIG